MRIILLTQDDPFYLGENIDYLLTNIPQGCIPVACVLFDPSPFGRKESLIKKSIRTFRVFGAKFFLRYAFQFLIRKLLSRNTVKNVLKKQGVPIIKLDRSINHPESIQIIKSQKPDLLVSIAGNQIFGEKLLTLAPRGCINLHTSLLPKYRGLMPSFWVLKENEKFTGVSVFYVNKGIDSGPILAQKRIEIGERSLEDLIRYTKKLGMDALIEGIELIHKGKGNLLPNPDSKMTYRSFPEKEDVEEFRRQGKRFF